MRKLTREVRTLRDWWTWYRAPRKWDGQHHTNVAIENYLIRALRKDSMDRLLAQNNRIKALQYRVENLRDETAFIPTEDWYRQLYDLFDAIETADRLS